MDHSLDADPEKYFRGSDQSHYFICMQIVMFIFGIQIRDGDKFSKTLVIILVMIQFAKEAYKIVS